MQETYPQTFAEISVGNCPDTNGLSVMLKHFFTTATKDEVHVSGTCPARSYDDARDLPARCNERRTKDERRMDEG